MVFWLHKYHTALTVFDNCQEKNLLSRPAYGANARVCMRRQCSVHQQLVSGGDKPLKNTGLQQMVAIYKSEIKVYNLSPGKIFRLQPFRYVEKIYVLVLSTENATFVAIC